MNPHILGSSRPLVFSVLDPIHLVSVLTQFGEDVEQGANVEQGDIL